MYKLFFEREMIPIRRGKLRKKYFLAVMSSSTVIGLKCAIRAKFGFEPLKYALYK